MRRGIVVAVLILAGVWGCGRSERERNGADATLQRAGSYRVSVENRPSRPRVGDNVLRITVSDSTGRPVRGAEVRAVVVMHAMGTMPRMESRGIVRELEPGRYEAKYGLSMAGEWGLTVSIRSPEGGNAHADYTISTSTHQIQSGSGSGAGPSGGEAARDTAGAGDLGHGPLGAVTLDASRRQEIGVRTAAVEKRRLVVPVRSAGRVAYDETRRAEISLKFSGWVREIHVDYTGQLVRAGSPLLTVYSPELLTAQQEFLEALRSSTAHQDETGAAADGAGARDPDIAASARQRLLLWDVAPAQIDEIATSGRPMEAVPILAPVSGVVVEKSVVGGSSFAAGQTLYKIAPVDPVWVVASVYQHELQLVREGMRASVMTPFQGEPARAGVVSYINPFLDPETRTGEVRLQVANPRGDLKPGMFVDVSLERELGERLAVPESAVLFAGDRRVVFIDLRDGRLVPRDVFLGSRAEGYYEVLGGLTEGDIVVTSGNFLIAAESRLQSAAQKY